MNILSVNLEITALVLDENGAVRSVISDQEVGAMVRLQKLQDLNAQVTSEVADAVERLREGDSSALIQFFKTALEQ